jgi:S-DNA-T family DNA segregation ATPase FtsK/SpoIIIE
MRISSISRFPRLKEVAGVVLLLAAAGFLIALLSYNPTDPSFNNATWVTPPANRMGRLGSHVSDLAFQSFGLAAYMLPLLAALWGLRWLLSRPVRSPFARLAGYGLMVASACCALAVLNPMQPHAGAFEIGGVTGYLAAAALIHYLNPAGAILFLFAALVVSLYLASSFSIQSLGGGLGAGRWIRFRQRAAGEAEVDPAGSGDGPSRTAEPAYRRRPAAAWAISGPPMSSPGLEADLAALDPPPAGPIADQVRQQEAAQLLSSARAAAGTHAEANGHAKAAAAGQTAVADAPPWQANEIPIRPLAGTPAPEILPPAPEPRKATRKAPPPAGTTYRLAPTRLLNPAPGREGFDAHELKETAARIKSKLEEFNVTGNVVQINPGPVVTTFEFKPDAGVKIARITTLTEDLCLGLQAESILIERIPGKPTVGIEVPNTRREMISLRQIFESEDFHDSPARLTMAMGKDISGRIRISELEKMPHLLIAGSTGSGKSVMLNTIIMSILFKSTPDEVRMILVDPKRVELGIYDGIPHLLTPVITEPKKAVNALRNAVLEMERRLKLLASYQVRNIEQFNKKIKQSQERPLNLFAGEEEECLEPRREKPLPYILIIIDELADLMMLERAGVEESVIRLAQMARAVGIHLVLATQRPSVDVITGLIKANFPARISFRVATRVDSRTVLDVMGAEHLLGKGDMLFLPPGSSRLLRVHGAYVTEIEIGEVVDFWKKQAQPEYDQSFLFTPPSEEEEDEEFEGDEDPMYRDAVRVICEMGKASTSILQRRLRLGYGRAARILDRMQKEGIISPPDGSRPRDVLRRPDWLDEAF